MKRPNNTNLLARFLADRMRNSPRLEELHCGVTPSTNNAYKDVKVVTPFGEIEWEKLSRISDPEMHELMKDVEMWVASALYYLQQQKVITVNSRNPRTKDFLDMIFQSHFERGVSWDRQDHEDI